MKRIVIGFAFVGLSVAAPGAQQAPTLQAARVSDAAASADVRGGSVTFDVGTNIFAISVHGKSSALDGRARVRENAGTLRLEQIEAVVPVDSLKTGMGQRDEHMRKYIFRTPDGKHPDLRFTAASAECTPAAGGGSTCVASGQLAIRGTSRPFSITLAVTQDGGRFRVSGDGKVTLSTYGIQRPSQFGVRTDDEVQLHLEFAATSVSAVNAARTTEGR
jgi:polyisoprenoid-binding protein YceI